MEPGDRLLVPDVHLHHDPVSEVTFTN